jgi:hypothetical protein
MIGWNGLGVWEGDFPLIWNIGLEVFSFLSFYLLFSSRVDTNLIFPEAAAEQHGT